MVGNGSKIWKSPVDAPRESMFVTAGGGSRTGRASSSSDVREEGLGMAVLVAFVGVFGLLIG